MKQRQESDAGFHYIETYASCNFKFYIRNCLKWEPKFKSPALNKGGAIHEAKARFYLHDEDPVGAYRDELQAISHLYEDKEDFEKDLKCGELMLDRWMQAYGMNWQEDYEILEVNGQKAIELPFEINLGADEFPIRFTGRFDGVFFDKRNKINIIEDTKTTSWSLDFAFENLNFSHQPTAYIHAWNTMFPEKKVEGLVADVMYQRKGTNGEAKCRKYPPIYRTKTQIENWLNSVRGYATEITQKVKSLADFPPCQLFPQRPSCDGDGGWKCEYRHLCWENPEALRKPSGEPPMGYQRRQEDE